MDNKKIVTIVLTLIAFIIASTVLIISFKPQMHKKIMLEKIIIKKEASKR